MWKVLSQQKHVQYECPISPGKKVMAKIKVFQTEVKLQGQGNEVRNYGTMWKDLSQEIHMCNMKALSLLVRKLWPRFKFFKGRSNFKVRVTRSEIMVPCERSCHKIYICVICKPYLFSVSKLWPRLKFFRSRSNFKVKVKRSKIMVPCEGVVTRYTYVQYESLISSGKKVMAMVKVFQKKVKLQGQGDEVTNNGTMWNVLSQEIHICNMKALSLLVRKLWPRLMFFRSRSNFKVKVTRSKFMVPCERSCRKKYILAIWKPYLFS